MDIEPSIMLGIGAALVLVLVLGALAAALVISKGGRRRHSQTTSLPRPSTKQTSARGVFTPKLLSAPLPPEPPIRELETWVGATRWEADGHAPPAPEIGFETPTSSFGGKRSQSANDVSNPTDQVVSRLRQEMHKLQGSGFKVVTLGYDPVSSTYCLQVSVSRGDQNIAIHFICTEMYPIIPPELIVTLDTIDRYSEVYQQRLTVNSPIIAGWTPSQNLTAVVNNVYGSLETMQPDDTPPSSTRVMDTYTELIS